MHQGRCLAVALCFMLFALSSFFYFRHAWPLMSFYDTIGAKNYSTVKMHIGGTRHWTRTFINETMNPNLLVLVLTHNKFSWGRKFKNSPLRTFQTFLDMIHSAQILASNLSLGLLTSSEDEYINYRRTLETVPSNFNIFACVRIIYHPGLDRKQPNVTSDSYRKNRHATSTQKERRRLIARLRNYLMLSSLRSEDHIVWFDADTYISSNGLLKTLIAQSTNSETKDGLPVGLLTARCLLDGKPFSNYDTNAWAGPRRVPNDKELEILRKGGIFIPMPTKNTKMLDSLVKKTSNNSLIKLDSVGGTVLYIKADLVRQGLTFPPYHVIGTEWAMQEGWDGIETEGLCYIARNLGYGCYALGGDWVVTHTNA